MAVVRFLNRAALGSGSNRGADVPGVQVLYPVSLPGKMFLKNALKCSPGWIAVRRLRSWPKNRKMVAKTKATSLWSGLRVDWVLYAATQLGIVIVIRTIVEKQMAGTPFGGEARKMP